MGKFMKTFKTSKRKYVTYKNGGRRRTETQVLAGNRGISKSSSELPNHVTEMTVENELNDEEPVEVNETNRHDQQGGAVSEPVAASMLPQPDYHETDSNIDVSKPTNHPDTTYSAKKTQRLNEWQNLENPFFQAWLQGNTPPSQCCKCGVSSDLYRCTDCSPWDNVCFECLQGRHALPHLHMFQAWKTNTTLIMDMGIVLAVVGCVFLGMLWYSPLLFGPTWMKYAYPGMNEAQIMEQGYGFKVAFVASVCSHVVVINLLYTFMQALSGTGSLYLAAQLSLFVCCSQLPHAVYSSQAVGHFILDRGYDVMCVMMGAFIISWWNAA